jgi:hypothetical protein
VPSTWGSMMGTKKPQAQYSPVSPTIRVLFGLSMGMYSNTFKVAVLGRDGSIGRGSECHYIITSCISMEIWSS